MIRRFFIPHSKRIYRHCLTSQRRIHHASPFATSNALPSNVHSITHSSLSPYPAAGPSASFLQTRTYLGGAGEMKSRRDQADVDAIAQREQELWNLAQPRYEAIMERHLRLPTIDSDSADGEAATCDVKEQELYIRRKRLIYRSKQRGWLEVDLLLGTWASENVPSLSLEELDKFESFVNLETIDIYNVLTLRSDVPEIMKSADGSKKSVVERIQDWAKASPLGKADKERYVELKRKNNLI